MSIALKLIHSHNINNTINYSLEDYKNELTQKKMNRKPIPLDIQIVESFDILPNEKFIWSERAIDIKIEGKEKEHILVISKGLEMQIEKAYNKLKPIKIKGLLSNHNASKNYLIESISQFSIENNKEVDIEPQAKSFNYTYTESSMHKNKLIDYLPKLNNSILDSNEHMHTNPNMNINHEMLQLDAQYEIMKRDLIELNPILKANSAIREQFFVNVSEGKEEKYVFIKNLYNIINDSAMYNKTVFKTTFNNKKLKLKNVPLPIQKKNNRQIIVNNFNGLRMLNRSASGSHLNIRRNKGLNFLEGINIK